MPVKNKKNYDEDILDAMFAAKRADFLRHEREKILAICEECQVLRDERRKDELPENA